MKTAGIICEYNPFHLGHAEHIERTREVLGPGACIVCVMSGNYVQRGDLAVFNKHARAKMAVSCGADIVIELPAPYALLSAGGFAKAGVYILDKLGVCDFISFGSESGNIGALRDAASAIVSDDAQRHIKDWLDKGLPYAAAQQKAADAVLGARASVFKSPNNILGIEYIKAIEGYNSKICPMTVRRCSGEHDTDNGYAASALRKKLLGGAVPTAMMPDRAARICIEEIESGRGPVSTAHVELAILSRLRVFGDYSRIPGVSEGLEFRFERYAKSECCVDAILEKVKTKRYAMSRLRRILITAALGITTQDSAVPPPYIRVLAMNDKGIRLLKSVKKRTELPVIIKPASVLKLSKAAIGTFNTEAAATDFYSLAYSKEEQRAGGREWRQSPVVLTHGNYHDAPG